MFVLEKCTTFGKLSVEREVWITVDVAQEDSIRGNTGGLEGVEDRVPPVMLTTGVMLSVIWVVDVRGALNASDYR